MLKKTLQPTPDPQLPASADPGGSEDKDGSQIWGLATHREFASHSTSWLLSFPVPAVEGFREVNQLLEEPVLAGFPFQPSSLSD